ncbi:hypothetical protein QVD17_25569 [Tagetes erecta]|uniref:Uncharacterized protein n=1 Tax=Tagetes erecta TaxID=13708 RepID=A0AAD8NV64_TARER|nr:hypothetical protein QVD17_25569 [Tagetes erecta]
MATSNTPANVPTNDKGDKQVPANDLSKSTSPSSSKIAESANKRKRESVAANVNINEKTTVSETEETGEIEKHVSAVETSNVKEVEMKDAESIDNSVVDQSNKEIEMQDADHETSNNETVSNLNASEGNTRVEKSIEDGKTHRENADEGCQEEPKEVERPESGKKQKNDTDGSGENVLGEVATLLKQVKESETNGKLQVEVKVKKMDDDNVKENGEVKECEPQANNRESG